MLSIIPSQNPNTIAMELKGKVVKEDVLKADQEIQRRFKDDEKFNVFAIVHELDGATANALLKDAKVDLKRWSQYNKVAIVSEKNWLENLTGLTDILPGIEAKHFQIEEAEEAWEWLKI